MQHLLAITMLCAASLTAQAANSDNAGTVVTAVAMSTGHMLVLSGKAIAYVPNAAGQAIIHHSKT